MLRDRPERMDVRTELEMKDWVQEYLHGAGKRYVFGCNQWGASIAEHVRVDGFIDDLVSVETFAEVPVVRSADADRSSMVVSAIIHARPLFAREFLKHSGFDYLDYFSLLKHWNAPLEEVVFWGDRSEKLKIHADQFASLSTLFKDSTSVGTYERIMALRTTLDLNVMTPFDNRQDEQYFETFFEYPPHGVFYDVGAYDGATSLEFVKRSPDYKAVHVFEPSAHNREAASTRLSHLANLHIHGKLLGHDCRMARVSEAGSSSKESPDGQVVEMASLDSLTIDPPTFIKVDIEGAELSFLAGARATIKQHKPVIAIACYHDIDHIWQIPELVLCIQPDYDVYLRHYTEGVTESVLFFVPRG